MNVTKIFHIHRDQELAKMAVLFTQRGVKHEVKEKFITVPHDPRLAGQHALQEAYRDVSRLDEIEWESFFVDDYGKPYGWGFECPSCGTCNIFSPYSADVIVGCSDCHEEFRNPGNPEV